MDKKTILLVEDQVITALHESKLISGRGYNVIIANSGKEAVENVKNHPDINLVLMDINLGKGIAGTEAAVEILAIREIPIVFLTSHSEKEMVDRVKGITRYGYILKNSGEFVLIESINMAFELFEANQKLKKSEQKFRRIFEEGQFGLIISDKNFKFTETNAEFCKMLGYTSEEFKTMTFKDITYEGHLEKDIENIQQIIRGLKTSYKTEKLYKKKNGELIWGSLVATAVRDERNELEFFIGMILDITERKKNEKNMEILKFSIEISLDGAFWMNKKGQFVYVNDAACKSLGYAKEELMQLTIFDVNTNITPDTWEEFWSYLRENKMIKSETVHKRKDGSLFPVEISSTYLKVLDEEYCNGFARDISSRNDIYDALKESEARYRLITEMTTDYFVKLSVSEQNEIAMVYASENFYNITGRTSEQTREMSSWSNIFHPDDMLKFKNFLGNMLNTGDSSTIECRTSVKGKERWISLTGKPQKDPVTGRVTSILGAVKDISDKKQIEESIKQSEEKYRTLIERLNTGIFMTTVDGKFIHVNSSLVEITKYGSVEELLNLPVDKLYADKSYRNKFVKEITENGFIKNMEIQIVNKDGSNSWMSISAVMIYDNAGKPLSILGTGFDITQNKRIENSIHFNELLLNESQHLAKIGSWVWDLGEKTLSWSNEVYHIFGVKPGDFKPSAEAFESMIHPEDRESFFKQRAEMLEEKQSACIDHRIVLPQGEIKYVQERTSLVMESGKVVRIIGTVQDITEQKHNEQLMIHNDEKYRILVENLNDVIFTISPEGIITYASPRLNAITGFDPDDVIGKTFNKIIYSEDIDSLQKSFEKVLTNKTRSSEFRYVRKNGEIHWARTSSRPLVENGEITGVYGIFSDITEKKIYEQALVKSESQLSGAMMMARLGPWEYDVMKDEFTFNDAFYAMLKTTAEEVGGYVMKSKDYADRFLHPDDRVLVGIETKKALETSDPNYTSHLSHRIIYDNGETGYLNVRIFIVKDKNRKTIKTYGFNQDITEQKKAENEIQKLLDERELLLTEVHHRIKNDMNIICSMLMIQIDSCDNPVIKNVLMETEVRINVMFNIYNELYMGKEFNYISLKTYITNLISNIKYIYSDQCYTVMNIDIDDIPINRKISFPIGMIINELLTNSYKYAFFDRKSYNNIITVIIHKKENGDMIVIAGDNGKGFPENILNNERPGFGLKLINMLSKQINGNIKLYNDNGACFEMHINAEFT